MSRFARRFSTRASALVALVAAATGVWTRVRHERTVQWTEEPAEAPSSTATAATAVASSQRTSVDAAVARRTAALARLATTDFDVVVIGGGAVGLYAALDAATRGFSVAVVEADDFGSGASGAAPALVHSGARFLQRAVRCRASPAVRDAFVAASGARELRRTAPAFVRDHASIVPYAHTTDCAELLLVALGLRAIKLAVGLARCERPLFAAEAQSLFPGLSAADQPPPEGAMAFGEGLVVDPPRLCVALARTAAARGACVVNHCPVVAVTKDASDPAEPVTGVVVDAAPGNGDTTAALAAGASSTPFSGGGGRFAVRGKVILNCSGAWLDTVKALAPQDPPLYEQFASSTWLLVPSAKCGLSPAGAASSIVVHGTASEGRSLMVLPFASVTTDSTAAPTPVATPPPAHEVVAASAASSGGGVWAAVRRAFGGGAAAQTTATRTARPAAPARAEPLVVVGAFEGGATAPAARNASAVASAAAADGGPEAVATARAVAARDASISVDVAGVACAARPFGIDTATARCAIVRAVPLLVSDEVVAATGDAMRRAFGMQLGDGGVVHAIGSGWSTARRAAAGLVDVAAERLGARAAAAAATPAAAAAAAAAFAVPSTTDIIGLVGARRDATDADAAAADAAAGASSLSAPYFRARYADAAVAAAVERRCAGSAPIVAGFPHAAAEIAQWAATEYALTVSDVVARRTALALAAPEETLAAIPAVAAAMAEALRWTPAHTRREIEAARALVAGLHHRRVAEAAGAQRPLAAPAAAAAS